MIIKSRFFLRLDTYDYCAVDMCEFAIFIYVSGTFQKLRFQLSPIEGTLKIKFKDSKHKIRKKQQHCSPRPNIMPLDKLIYRPRKSDLGS